MKNTPLFSKGQRIAIVLLLFLIVAIWLADSLIARFATPPEAHHERALPSKPNWIVFPQKSNQSTEQPTISKRALQPMLIGMLIQRNTNCISSTQTRPIQLHWPA